MPVVAIDSATEFVSLIADPLLLDDCYRRKNGHRWFGFVRFVRLVTLTKNIDIAHA